MKHQIQPFSRAEARSVSFLPNPEDEATEIENMRFDTLPSPKQHRWLYSLFYGLGETSRLSRAHFTPFLDEGKEGTEVE